MPLLRLFFVILISVISISIAPAQTVWQDGFADGDFTQNPTWQGDTANFDITPTEELQLNAPAVSATTQLSTPSTAAIAAQWQFYARMAFNPSTNNYCRVFLMSTSADFSQPLNGYFLRIGGSTTDNISLYRQSGSATVLIAESADNVVDASVVELNIRVTRDSTNDWTILLDTALTGTFLPLATGNDATWQSSQYFGVSCTYTSTRSDKFFFDNFSVAGSVFTDSKAPKIQSFAPVGTQQIALSFTEPIDSISARKTGNYRLFPGSIFPQNAIWRASNPTEIQLTFASPFANNTTYQLDIEEVEDNYGNTMADTSLFFDFYRPAYRDVVINEVMADPDPPVGLPNAEYIELRNQSARAISLANFRLALDDDTLLLPADTLQPNAYVLICSTLHDTLFNFTDHISLPLGSSWLRNSGENIVLLDDENAIIDAVDYADSWYQNTAKQGGGWSLAQIEANLPCSEPQNWCASAANLGGTPGAPNQPEFDFYNSQNVLKAIFQPKNNLLKLKFSRAFQADALPTISTNWQQPTVSFSTQNPNELQLEFVTTLPENAISIFIGGISSCQNTLIADTFRVGLATNLESNALVLNEILFNPKPEGSDFVEVWNTTAATFLLSDLRLAKTDEFGNLVEIVAFSEDNRLLLPSQFLVFSESEADVCDFYNCSKSLNFVEANLPSWPDDAGGVAICTKNLEIIEHFWYDEDYHHALVSNPEGVSLERINPDLPAEDALSWHSAAAAVGYATPGKANSQYLAANTQNARFTLSSETFSPNNDGFNDVLQVSYLLPQGAMLSARVFSLAGVEVKELADNALAQPEGALVWDGTSTEGQTLATGIYVILFEWFTPTTSPQQSKLTVVLAN